MNLVYLNVGIELHKEYPFCEKNALELLKKEGLKTKSFFRFQELQKDLLFSFSFKFFP